MLLPFPVLDSHVVPVGLQLERPSYKSSVTAIEIEQPLQSGVIGLKCELCTIQVAVKVSHTSYDRQAFKLGDCIVRFGWCERSRDEGYRMFPSLIVELTKNPSND
jgi:hypothetical protein